MREVELAECNLLEEERAIVTDVPGTTRVWWKGEICIGGYSVTLIDTAGLRNTTAPLRKNRSRAISGPSDGRDLALYVGGRGGGLELGR